MTVYKMKISDLKTPVDIAREKRRIWQSSCQGKEQFETRAQAQAVNQRRAKRGRRGKVYSCSGCSKYHIGDRT